MNELPRHLDLSRSDRCWSDQVTGQSRDMKKESSMNTRKLKGAIVFAAAVLVTAQAFGQAGTDKPGTVITTPGGERYSEAWYRPATRWQKSGDLIGKPVTSSAGGDRIAEVKDI